MPQTDTNELAQPIRQSVADSIRADFSRYAYEDRTPSLDLSTENIERAVAQYASVQAANRACYRATHPCMSATAEAVLDHFRKLRSPYQKSALLIRLLAGKRALRYPAPTSMSYPAYGFVEEDKPFRAVLGTSRKHDPGFLTINQCRYQIVESNAAARVIQMLIQDDASFDRVMFLDAAAKAPVWTVRWGEWPAWELTVGIHAVGAGRRGSVTRRVNSLTLENALWSGWGPIQITEVQTTGQEVKERLEATVACLPGLREKQARGEYMAFDELANLNSALLCEQDLASATSSPADLDWIAFKQQTWIIRRSAEWAGFTDIYHPCDTNQAAR